MGRDTYLCLCYLAIKLEEWLLSSDFLRMIKLITECYMLNVICSHKVKQLMQPIYLYHLA